MHIFFIFFYYLLVDFNILFLNVFLPKKRKSLHSRSYSPSNVSFLNTQVEPCVSMYVCVKGPVTVCKCVSKSMFNRISVVASAVSFSMLMSKSFNIMLTYNDNHDVATC